MSSSKKTGNAASKPSFLPFFRVTTPELEIMEQIKLHEIIISQALRVNKFIAKKGLWIYCIVRLEFFLKSGLFTVPELDDAIIKTYGYTGHSVQSGGNRAKRHKELYSTLRTFPNLFIESSPDIFRLVSYKQFKNNSKTRNDFYLIDKKSLHKNNKSRFYDNIIGTQQDGKVVDYKTTATATGFSSARVQQASDRNHESKFMTKTNNLIREGLYHTRKSAEIAMYKLRKKNILSKVIENRFFSDVTGYCIPYMVVFWGANSYTSNIMLGEKSGNTYVSQPMEVSTRFNYVCTARPYVNICDFKKLNTGDAISTFILDHS